LLSRVSGSEHEWTWTDTHGHHVQRRAGHSGARRGWHAVPWRYFPGWSAPMHVYTPDHKLFVLRTCPASPLRPQRLCVNLDEEGTQVLCNRGTCGPSPLTRSTLPILDALPSSSNALTLAHATAVGHASGRATVRFPAPRAEPFLDPCPSCIGRLSDVAGYTSL
jgi:hypothetical protein